jgi:VWFA-related protein
MHRRLPRLLRVLAAAGALAAGPEARTQSLSPAAPGVRAAVEVTALDLDVVATKDGKFVSDLTKDDFTVRVDGKQVPIDFFTKVEAGQLVGPDLAGASPDLILDSYKASTGDRYLARQFVLFFDDEHMLPDDIPRAVEGARDLVTRLAPSDQAAVFCYNRGTTRVLTPFTSSKEELLAGLSRLASIPPNGLQWENDFQQSRRDAASARTAGGRSSAVRSWAQQTYNRERVMLGDLRRALSALAARSGKRILLYVSSGFEMRPGQSFSLAVGTRLLQQFDYTVAPDFGKTVREANAAGITIYAVDARGLVPDIDAADSAVIPVNRFFTDANRREGMAGFAGETGGQIYENRNTFKGAVDQIVREAGSFYSLGVTLSSLPKKEEHRVEVTTRRPGVVVRTRRSFVPKAAGQAVLDRTEMALVTPDVQGDFPVEVVVGPAKSAGSGRRLSPFEVRVPVSALSFRDVAGRKEAEIDFSFAAVEDNGDRSTPVVQRRRISIDPAAWNPEKSPFYALTGEAKSRTGNQRFVAAVRDVTTNRIGIGSASVRIE